LKTIATGRVAKIAQTYLQHLQLFASLATGSAEITETPNLSWQRADN